MSKILIIEDEPAMRLGLTQTILRAGYLAETANDGEDGLNKVTEYKPDLILLDLILPRMDGLEVCQQLRKAGFNMPIIILTARNLTSDKVSGLDMGADDYVTKPFKTKELLARIKAALRKYSRDKGEIGECSFGDCKVDFKSKTVLKKGKEIKLSVKEFAVLKLLITCQGETVDRNEFLEEIWGYEGSPTTRTVDFHILLLRKKLEEDPSNPKHIITYHGRGYRFIC